MPIAVKTLFRDSINFSRNHLGGLLILSIIAAVMAQALLVLFLPEIDTILNLALNEDAFNFSDISRLVEQLPPEQQMLLLKNALVRLASFLLGNTLLVGGLLTFVHMISKGQSVRTIAALGHAVPTLPRLLLLLLVMNMLTQVGISLFIIPGALIGVALCLSPVIFYAEKSGIFSAFRTSYRLVFANLRTILPALMLWLLAKFVLLVVFSTLLQSASVDLMVMIIQIGSNMISCILMVYLYRFYMLLPR